MPLGRPPAVFDVRSPGEPEPQARGISYPYEPYLGSSAKFGAIEMDLIEQDCHHGGAPNRTGNR